jgi:peptide-methionine (S)-S-oxide reductase
METATFGAGCFWGVEHAFRQIPGVVDTLVGYEGGSMPNPTYKDVCTDRTGHAEVVQVSFDPAKVSYETLLDAFFDLHDPTQVDRQGPDHGTQYRTVVFYHSPAQQAAAQKAIAARGASGRYRKPIATQVVPATTFYPAEDYHQRYFEKQGIAPTCHT